MVHKALTKSLGKKKKDASLVIKFEDWLKLGGYSNRKEDKLDVAPGICIWCYVLGGGWGGNKNN